MTPPEAVRLIAGYAGVSPSAEPVRALAVRLGGWPLMLALAGAALRVRCARGETIDRGVAYLSQLLQEEGVLAFDRRNPAERNQAIATTLKASLDLLASEERESYLALAVFPPEVDVPINTVGALWGLTPLGAERRCERLADLGLIRLDLATRTVRLHEVIGGYLVDQAADIRAVHTRLLDAWGNPYDLADVYAWRWIGHHLVQAGRVHDLRSLLLDLRWIRAKLSRTDVSALVGDYNLLPDDSGSAGPKRASSRRSRTGPRQGPVAQPTRRPIDERRQRRHRQIAGRYRPVWGTAMDPVHHSQPGPGGWPAATRHARA